MSKGIKNMKKIAVGLIIFSMLISALNGCSSKKTEDTSSKIQTVKETTNESTKLPTQPEETETTQETVQFDADKTILFHFQDELNNLLEYISDLIEKNVTRTIDDFLAKNNSTLSCNIFKNSKLDGEKVLTNLKVSKIKSSVTFKSSITLKSEANSMPRNGMLFYFSGTAYIEGNDENGEIVSKMMLYNGYLEHYGIVLKHIEKIYEDYDLFDNLYDCLVVDEDLYTFFSANFEYINEQITGKGEWYDQTHTLADEYEKNLLKKNEINDMDLAPGKVYEKEYTYE